MIAANKRLIKANLTQGVVGIQNNLITLYSNNLNSVATQAALIAGFAFTAVSNGSLTLSNSISAQVLSYLFYALFTLSFVAALWTLSQATIVVMFGPSLALKGESETSVKTASELMRDQQSFVFAIGSLSVTALFLGSCILSWAIYPLGVAVITTVFYVLGYYLLATNGIKAYKMFVPENDVTLGEADVKPLMGSTSNANNGGDTDKSRGGSVVGGVTEKPTGPNPHEMKKFKYKGVIWQRRAAEEGGLFFKCYGVLKDGRMDFYRTEQDYLDHNNPINKKPYKMWQYNVETDQRKFARAVTSLRNTMKAAMLGNDGQDFAVSDIMTSEHDLAFAAKHYRFALMPKVASELQAVENVELLAHDERVFEEWLYALRTVISAYDEIAAAPTVDITMKYGSSDVEVVVQAANA